MNFIDKALSEITNGEDFVQAMADIYEHAEVRKEFGNLPSWIQNIITVIDYRNTVIFFNSQSEWFRL